MGRMIRTGLMTLLAVVVATLLVLNVGQAQPGGGAEITVKGDGTCEIVNNKGTYKYDIAASFNGGTSFGICSDPRIDIDG